MLGCFSKGDSKRFAFCIRLLKKILTDDYKSMKQKLYNEGVIDDYK